MAAAPLLDANPVSALWRGEASAPRVALSIASARPTSAILISAPVFAELCAQPGAGIGELDVFLARAKIEADFVLGEDVWREAGAAFARFAERRRRTGVPGPRRLLTDFVIGAHALCRGARLISMDAAFFRREFPTLRVIDSLE